MPPVSFYGEEIDKYSRQLQVLQRKILLIAFLRMALFVLVMLYRYRGLTLANQQSTVMSGHLRLKK